MGGALPHPLCPRTPASQFPGTSLQSFQPSFSRMSLLPGPSTFSQGALLRVTLQTQPEWSRLGGGPVSERPRSHGGLEDPGAGQARDGLHPFPEHAQGWEPTGSSPTSRHPSASATHSLCWQLTSAGTLPAREGRARGTALQQSPAAFLSWLGCPRVLGSSTGSSVVSEWPWTSHTLSSVKWMICTED